MWAVEREMVVVRAQEGMHPGLSPIWSEKSAMVPDLCRLHHPVSKCLHFEELVRLCREVLQMLGFFFFFFANLVI